MRVVPLCHSCHTVLLQDVLLITRLLLVADGLDTRRRQFMSDNSIVRSFCVQAPAPLSRGVDAAISASSRDSAAAVMRP